MRVSWHYLCLCLISVAATALVACGDATDEAAADGDAQSVDARGNSDESNLPDDFPRDLIPPDYDSVRYVDTRSINGAENAIFESSAPVQDSIDHYVGLLGAPTLNISAAAGGGTAQAQWHETSYPPWLVATYGTDSEWTVTVSKPPAQ